jgi:hypothetical protein
MSPGLLIKLFFNIFTKIKEICMENDNMNKNIPCDPILKGGSRSTILTGFLDNIRGLKNKIL